MNITEHFNCSFNYHLELHPEDVSPLLAREQLNEDDLPPDFYCSCLLHWSASVTLPPLQWSLMIPGQIVGDDLVQVLAW